MITWVDNRVPASNGRWFAEVTIDVGQPRPVAFTLFVYERVLDAFSGNGERANPFCWSVSVSGSECGGQTLWRGATALERTAKGAACDSLRRLIGILEDALA